MENTILVCSECGSEDIEVKTWVNPNTNEIGDVVSNEEEDCWCNDCQEHCTLKLKTI
ncbi:MAG TPA: hypothetical protein PLN85_03600 [archaeon]|jgi:hypothetical protein|nr:hypothetical protein [archaeon]